VALKKRERRDTSDRRKVAKPRQITGLHQPFADGVEGKLTRPFANAGAVAAECALDCINAVCAGERDVDEADGFLFCCAAGAGYSGDSRRGMRRFVCEFLQRGPGQLRRRLRRAVR